MVNFSPKYGTIYSVGLGDNAECYQLCGFIQRNLYWLISQEAEPYEIYCYHERSFKVMDLTPLNLAEYAKRVVQLFESSLISKEAFESIRLSSLKHILSAAPNFLSQSTEDCQALISELNMLRAWVGHIKPAREFEYESTAESAAHLEKETSAKISKLFSKVFA